MENVSRLLKVSLLFMLIVTANGCGNDFDDSLKAENPLASDSHGIIGKNSDLFALMTQVTTPNNNVLEEIVCIDFVYPITLQIYDQQLNVIGTRTLIGDIEFSAFLDTFPGEQSLSISYPISTTLSDNTVFSVNNNTELQMTLESCTREDIINYYNNLFGGNSTTSGKCVWKVPYETEADNKYAGSIIEANGDGTLKLTFQNTSYNGTWNFLFINDEFHLNMNFEGSSAIAADWNIDQKISYIDNTIYILKNPKNLILRQSCETTAPYAIGATGQAGGIVFYDKGFYSNGWRYIEVGAEDIGFFEWGCADSDIVFSSSATIGNGLYNSVAIANFHDSLDNFYENPAICNLLNNGTVSARKALLKDAGGFKDWFLPTTAELQLVYENIKVPGGGNFAETLYWTSTQTDALQAQTINFATGEIVNTPKVPALNVVNTRAVRYF